MTQGISSTPFRSDGWLCAPGMALDTIRSEWMGFGRVVRVLLVVVLFGLGPARGESYRFETWTTERGLPQNSVYAIRQAPDGYLWLTTFDGLVRFDGVRFTVFNRSNTPALPTNRLKYLSVTQDGSLWFTTERQTLVRCREGVFHVFTTQDGLPSNEVFEIQADHRGGLILLTGGGVVRWRGSAFTPETWPSYRERTVVYEGPSGTRWGIEPRALVEIRDGHETRYPLPFDPDRPSADVLRQKMMSANMVETSDGCLWIGLPGALYRLKNGAFTTFSKGAPRSRINLLTQDRYGNLWLGTGENGACQFDGAHFTCYGPEDGLEGIDINDIFEDREGVLWLGSNGRGLSRRIPQVVTALSSSSGIVDRNVYPVLAAADGSVWIGTENGLSRYANGHFENFGPHDGLKKKIVQALYEDREGTLWIGAVAGLQRRVKGRFEDVTKQMGLPRGAVWVIREDSHKTLWIGMENGLLRYDGSGAVHRYTKADGMPSDDVKDILVSRDGSLWLATYNGLARFDGARFTSWTEHDGLASNYTRCLYEEEDGTLWIGTYDRGLSRLRGGRFTNFTMETGLFSDGVFAIVPDSRDYFWMTSNQGISRVKRTALEAYAEGRLARIETTGFGVVDGMLSVECNGGRQPSATRTADGRLWVPTQNGVAVIDPDSVPNNPLAPPVVVESVTVEGRSVPFADSVSIGPSDRQLAIQYTAPSLIKSEQVRFRYRLEDVDKDWTEAGTRRAAFYPYLPPGRYRFHVIAANCDGVWNLSGATVPITVLPAFHQTRWFQALVGLVVIASAVAFHRRRTAKLQKARAAQEEFSQGLIRAHEMERRRIAAELHDSLGQSLALIKNSAVYGASAAEHPDMVRTHLDGIATQASQAISEVREIAHNLRPYLLDRLGLTQALRSMLRRVDESSGVRITSDVDEIDRLYPEEAELSLYRIVQECLNNVLKHAGASELIVTIKRTAQGVRIAIRDDGKGFDPHAESPDGESRRAFGLAGMGERVRLLGGTRTIESAPGHGTSIIIKVPYRGHHEEPSR